VDKAALAAAGVDADTPDMTPWLMPRDRPEPRSRRFSNSPLEIEFTAKQELLEVLKTLQGDVIQHLSFLKWPVWDTFAAHLPPGGSMPFLKTVARYRRSH
jgi:hypothetical protein